MKTQRMLVALTVLNLGLLALLLAQIGPPEASSAAPVLRGRALEIVDERGRVRASIQVQPAGTVDGTPYPETVIPPADRSQRTTVREARRLRARRRARPAG
jgi:hypothetical protein